MIKSSGCMVTAFVVYTSQTAFHFFLCFLFWRTTLHIVSRASFSHIPQSRKKQLGAEMCHTFNSFLWLRSNNVDNNLYPTDHRSFEPSNPQQWKHSICSFISSFLASKSYSFRPRSPWSLRLKPELFGLESEIDSNMPNGMYSQWDFGWELRLLFFYFLVSQF